MIMLRCMSPESFERKIPEVLALVLVDKKERKGRAPGIDRLLSFIHGRVKIPNGRKHLGTTKGQNNLRIVILTLTAFDFAYQYVESF